LNHVLPAHYLAEQAALVALDVLKDLLGPGLQRRVDVLVVTVVALG